MKILFSKSAPSKSVALLAVFVSIVLFVSLISIYLPSYASSSKSLTVIRPKVVLDAGHGGFDGGADSHSGGVEKDINLEIAKKTYFALRFFGFDVVMTRSSDTALAHKKKDDMYERLKIIKSYPDSIFISIHQNHYSQQKYSGAQMFYGRQNEDDSYALALVLQENFKQKLNPNNTRQVKKAGNDLFLFKNSPQPSVLVECGFLSNYEESRLLEDDEYQTKIALTIAQSIAQYYNLERNFKNGSTEV